MQIILKVGANLGSKRYEPSDRPQEVPPELAKAMLARGDKFAVKAPQSPQARSAKRGDSDE